MHGEREELVKRTFPQLRKLCEERGVDWSEVDLRWGITDEQKAEGKVLLICMEEIRRCRPFFIGLLGERYGWVPEDIPPEPIEREPWLAEHRDRSVTELEILHGVLNNPEVADHAFFYFRDPSYIDRLPSEQQKEFRETASADDIERLGHEQAERRVCDRRRKLADLKDRIRASGLPVREDYSDPHALGDLILRDFVEAVDRLYPAGSEPDPLELEASAHRLRAKQISTAYVPSEDLFARLDQHASSDGPPLVVVGETGSGKSSLLANWFARRREKKPDELAAIYFVGSSEFGSDWAVIVRLFLRELHRHFGTEERVTPPREKLPGVLSESLNALPTGERVLLLIDGLDRLGDDGEGQPLEWLRRCPPRACRLVVSTSPGRCANLLSERGWPFMEMDPLTITQRERCIETFLARYSKTLDARRSQRIASCPACATPLFLRALLDEIRVFGSHEYLDREIDFYLSASNVVDLYGKILGRWERDYEELRPDLVRESMACIWGFRRGVAEAELRRILGEEEAPLPQRIWSPLLLAAEEALMRFSGHLDFANACFRQAVETRFLSDPNTRRQVHRELASYFLYERGASERQYTELPWHLAQAEDWDRLRDYVTDPDVLFALFANHSRALREYWHELDDRYDMASCLERTLKTWSAQSRPPDWHMVNVLAAAAQLVDEAGHVEQSLPFLRWELSVRQRMKGPSDPSTVSCRQRISEAQTAADRAAGDVEPDLSALDLFAVALGIEHPDTSEQAAELFFKAMDSGRTDLARGIVEKYLAWMFTRQPDSLTETQRKIVARLRRTVHPE